MQAEHAVFLQDSQLCARGHRQLLEIALGDFVRAAPDGDSVGGLKLFSGFDQHGDYYAQRVPSLSTDSDSLDFSVEPTEMFPSARVSRQSSWGTRKSVTTS
jgi:hypothetical protein